MTVHNFTTWWHQTTTKCDPQRSETGLSIIVTQTKQSAGTRRGAVRDSGLFYPTKPSEFITGVPMINFCLGPSLMG